MAEPILYRGTIPEHVLYAALADKATWDHGADVLVTIYADGTGEVALRTHNRWGIPARIEETQ